MRLSLARLLGAEGGVVVIALALAGAVPPVRAHAVAVACVVGTLLVLHAAVVPFCGLGFVVRDEPADSPVKLYFFAALFVAVFSGNHLADALLARSL